MSNRKKYLNGDQTDWLLMEDNPSVRYFALVHLINKSIKDEQVIDAKQRIMNHGLVPKILDRQAKGGYWGIAEDFYIRSKYKGTVWSFLVLAELGADGNNERIKKTCEFILNNSQDPHSGGFAYVSSKDGGGDHNKVLPCLTGNMVWCLIRFGYLGDRRVQHGIDWITTYQRFDDGIDKKPKGWPYDRYENCWGKHTCHMGVVKGLKALAEIPVNKRSKEVKKTMEKSVEYILKHHIYKRSHDLSNISKPSWLRFRFPLMWQTDVLEILLIITKIGVKDERMQEAIDLLVSKQNPEGKWNLENTYNGRMQVNIEQKGKPSKWITLNALRVLKSYYG